MTAHSHKGGNNVFRDAKEIACNAVILNTAAITEISEASARAFLTDGVERDVNARITELSGGKSETEREKVVSYAAKMLGEFRKGRFQVEGTV